MAIPTLAEKVRIKREELGMTQKDLAKKSNLTQATISRVESGEVTQLRSENLAKLAKALGVTADFLAGNRARMEFDETLTADETAKVIFRGFENLSEDRKQQLRDYVLYLLELQKKERAK